MRLHRLRGELEAQRCESDAVPEAEMKGEKNGKVANSKPTRINFSQLEIK